MHLCFPLLSLLDTLRRYVSSSLGCLYFLIFPCTWSPRSELPLSPLDNSLLFKTELIPIQDCRVYFSQRSHRRIPLKSVQGLAQILDSTALAHASWVYTMPHVVARYVFLASSHNFYPSLDMIIHAYAICIYSYISYHT